MLVVGGGTAGHVIPAKPLIERLRQENVDVLFVGSHSGLEEKLVADLDIAFASITTGKLRRYISFENVVDMFRVLIGIVQSIRVVRRFKPNVVFSKGGYVAFPIVVASWLCGIPVVAHESDMTPGLSNRLSLPFVRTLCVNFSETRVNAKRVVVTGTPMRGSLLHGDRNRGRSILGTSPDDPIVLVVGGSLGAESINRVVRDSLSELQGKFFVVHVCGRGNIEESLMHEPKYRQYEFVDTDWGDLLATADIVVSRAGANSLYELLSLRKPHVLVPLSRKASRGDQIENASMSANQGWSLVIQEEILDSTSLTNSLDQLWGEREYWRQKLDEFPVMDSVALIHTELKNALNA